MIASVDEQGFRRTREGSNEVSGNFPGEYEDDKCVESDFKRYLDTMETNKDCARCIASDVITMNRSASEEDSEYCKEDGELLNGDGFTFDDNVLPNFVDRFTYSQNNSDEAKFIGMSKKRLQEAKKLIK